MILSPGIVIDYILLTEKVLLSKFRTRHHYLCYFEANFLDLLKHSSRLLSREKNFIELFRERLGYNNVSNAIISGLVRLRNGEIITGP